MEESGKNVCNKLNRFVRSKVLTAVLLMIQVFSGATLCHWVSDSSRLTLDNDGITALQISGKHLADDDPASHPEDLNDDQVCVGGQLYEEDCSVCQPSLCRYHTRAAN